MNRSKRFEDPTVNLLKRNHQEEEEEKDEEEKERKRKKKKEKEEKEGKKSEIGMNEVTGLLTPMQFMHNLHLIYEDEKEMNKYGTTENF